MKTSTHEVSAYSEDLGTTVTVHITVTHPPGFEIDKEVLDSAATSTVDCVFEDAIYELVAEVVEVTPYDLGLL